MLTAAALLIVIGISYIILRHLQAYQELQQRLLQLSEHLNKLQQSHQHLPQSILRCLQGSVNHVKGQTAELIAYLQLHSAYDRLVPFNNVIDFIGIRYPRENDPGRLDFIDIKTGSARLSPEQVKLRQLVENKQVYFIKVKIRTEVLPPPEEQECEST